MLYKGISSLIKKSILSSCPLQGSRFTQCSKMLRMNFFAVRFRAFSKEDNDVAEFNKELEAVFGRPLPQDPYPRESTNFGTSDHSQSSLSANSILTHVDDSGKTSMVNITEKASSHRLATASGRVSLGSLAFNLVCANKIAKGDVLTVAQIAGIQAAKQTSHLIPLCHNILLTGVKVDLSLNKDLEMVEVCSEVSSTGPTGVEMEALTAVSVACLTVYDMCKAVSKEIQISNIQLESKSGGKSGDWHRTKM